MNRFFFELLQVAIGNRQALTSRPTDEEWELLYYECEKHALLGIAFCGVERLPREQFPPFDVAAEWVHDAQVAKERNILLNQRCKEVCEYFKHDGFNSCILKGQSNLINYPEYLRDYRTAGDIDVLCWPKNGCLNRMKVLAYVKNLYDINNNYTKPEILYHHVDWEFAGISVEIHFRASYFLNPLYNRRFQNWVNDSINSSVCLREQEFPIPSVSFNAVYQLTHIYRHFLSSGVGLRQLLDYYFVLRRVGDERLEIIHVIERLGLKKFASAVMYVLQLVFAMPDAYLLCHPNKLEGEFLLSEIILSGNFGVSDNRQDEIRKVKNAKSHFSTFIARQRFASRLLQRYPSEGVWSPFWSIFLFFYIRWQKWKW